VFFLSNNVFENWHLKNTLSVTSMYGTCEHVYQQIQQLYLHLSNQVNKYVVYEVWVRFTKKQDSDVTGKLRDAKQYPVPWARSERFKKSTIVYALSHYQ